MQTNLTDGNSLFGKKSFGVQSNSYSITCDAEQYHSNRSAVSRSQLLPTLRSAAHFKEALIAPKRRQTEGQLLGTLVHMATLEPDRFSDTVVAWQGQDKIGFEYKRFLSQNEGKTIIDRGLFDKVCRMRDAILNLPLPHNLDSTLGDLIREGESEKTIFWTDQETGIVCRIRIDNLFSNLILDIKTCGDAREKEFLEFMLLKQDLDLQAAMYHEGVKAYTGKSLNFMFIAVEDEAPHSVVLHETGPGTQFFENGMAKFRYALSTLAKARRDQSFQDYSGGYHAVDKIPARYVFRPK